MRRADLAPAVGQTAMLTGKVAIQPSVPRKTAQPARVRTHRSRGAETRVLMPASLALGGAALVLCDLVGRGAFRWLHREVPVGAVTALIGGPFFLWLLIRR